MKRFRILLLSNTRPSRAWKMATRIAEEIRDAEICGLVQRPMHTLAQAQQMIVDCPSPRGWLASATCRLVDWALWLVHGCPSNQKKAAFTVERLAGHFREAGLPFLLAESFGQTKVTDFICKRRPDLIVVLGDFRPEPELVRLPLWGLISVYEREVESDGTKTAGGREIKLQHFAKDAELASVITRINVPLQPYDAFPELTLKTDLIADDLLLQAARQLQTGDPAAAAEAVSQWADSMFSPYLRQLEPASNATTINPPVPLRRSSWKLCMDTLLLCSPLIAGRNWYRRLRRRYPVLILAHHLVCDRPHPMGISTAHLWQQIRFLQRHYRFVSLSKAADLLRLGKVTVPTLVLTFDDGYMDNLLSLRAVAEEADVPVAVFVVVDPVTNHREFQHDLDAGIKGMLPLTWEQIRYWADSGAEFGSHTRTHFDCRSTDQTRLQQEIVESKTDLEAQLERPVNFFAFPFGKQNNISLPALEIAKSAYPHFLSSHGGENSPNDGSNHQHLLRKEHFPHPWELELELQSVFDLVKVIKQAFRAMRPRGSRLLAKFRGVVGRIQQTELPAAD